MISTVAVGTDGSDTAEMAVRQAADLAKRYGAKLVLLSAFGKQEEPTERRDDVELQWVSNSSARLATLLERTEDELRQEGISCETLTDEGNAADVLVRLASECDADMLVIGNKGMKRRVLGSVPNSVAHKADCSVMVVKTI
jgi:nucleotide-binding universal stress UspA family protein